MHNKDFTTAFSVDQSPREVFEAITNVRGWWSELIEGDAKKVNDEFTYHYLDVHRCKIRLTEVVPDKKIVWLVLDNYFNFTVDENEWTGTQIVFEISMERDKTNLLFTHRGLVPEYECYNACVNGWSQYIQRSLVSLITTGKGLPNTSKTAFTTHEVAARFNELAQQEKWFEIQDELFSEDVKSIDPANSAYFKNAEGKSAVRKKGEEWVKKITAAHRRYTTQPVVSGNYFSVGREVDITVEGLGRINLNEIMLYEVKDGQIVSEQFFY